MAHQTGIKASQDLKDKFGEAAGPKIRLIKVQIVDEQLQPVESKDACGSWEDDILNFGMHAGFCVGVVCDDVIGLGNFIIAV
jgi:hypothetical protein